MTMTQQQHAWAVIPARFGSSRFPGKPLARETGKYLIQHVVERVRLARRIKKIVVATDDQRIAEAVASFGGEAMMTGEHPNGTARIAEVVSRLRERGEKAEVVVNVQGDEPEIEPGLIDQLVEVMGATPSLAMGTVASPFAAGENPGDRNIVKVVCDQRGRALYFSRSMIPCFRDAADPAQVGAERFLKHIGMYAYRAEFLLKYVAWPATPLEQAEQLEQLRVLEHGEEIAVVRAEVKHHGIDTPQQYAAFVKRNSQVPGA